MTTLAQVQAQLKENDELMRVYMQSVLRENTGFEDAGFSKDDLDAFIEVIHAVGFTNFNKAFLETMKPDLEKLYLTGGEEGHLDMDKLQEDDYYGNILKDALTYAKEGITDVERMIDDYKVAQAQQEKLKKQEEELSKRENPFDRNNPFEKDVRF